MEVLSTLLITLFLFAIKLSIYLIVVSFSDMYNIKHVIVETIDDTIFANIHTPIIVTCELA